MAEQVPGTFPSQSGKQSPHWGDLTAGLCVAGLLIPEAVAYAGLARLPVASALSATLVGLALYALWGRSRFAVVSPTSATAALSAAAVLSLPGVAGTADAAAYLQALSGLVLLAGLAMVLLAWAGQGQLSAFVSRPVLRGFAFALAITIVVRQLPDAFGFTMPPNAGTDPFHVLWFALDHTADWHLPSVLVALAAGTLLLALRRWPQLPASMLVMVCAIAAAGAFNLHALGVQEVGAVTPPAFRLAIPQFPLDEWLRLAELAFGLVVLVFAESWGSMRTAALRAGDTLDPNRELLVLGVCNAAAALLQGMAVGAGFSATSANASAGARSRWSGVVALAVIAAALAMALPVLHLLPRPVLAVAVISALWHALSPGPLVAVWRMQRDRMLVVGSVAAVLVLGVLYGMLMAIGLSIVAALRNFSQPVVHELGELGTTRNFVVLDAHSAAAPVAGLLVLRPEEPLFFASAERVVAEVVRMAGARPAAQTVVLSLEESADLDSTAAECLLELNQRLAHAGKLLVLARAKDAVRALLATVDPQGIGRTDRMFFSVADAVTYIQDGATSVRSG